MYPPDPRSVIRIAIALAALKLKPRDQSIASYLLDIQSRFPLATKDNNAIRDWRTHALELEKQLGALKAQRDVDLELLSKLPADASQATLTNAPPKKKSKKNPAKDQHDLEWTWDQTRADWSRFLSVQYPPPPSLVAAYTGLKGVLASPGTDSCSHASRLTDAILRALNTIHIFLFSTPNLNPNPQTPIAFGTPPQLDPQHIDRARIAMTSPLLMYLLRTALPALLSNVQSTTIKVKRPRQHIHPIPVAVADTHTLVDSVLDHLLERVLVPLLRALAPLCFARLAPLITPPPKKPSRPVAKNSSRDKGKGKSKEKDKNKDKRTDSAAENTDTRTDTFALIGASLHALDALPPLDRPPDQARNVAAGIRDRLGLEVIRELEALYVDSRPPSTSEPPGVPQPRAKRLERLAGTRAERVRALATRDAGWFLASTLNLCVTSTDAPSGDLLREALLDRVGKLIRSMPAVSGSETEMQDGHPTFSIDPVCQNMLLAICERAMTQLAPCL